MSNYEKFEKKLIGILNSTSNAKSWSDLLKFAKEILVILKKNEKEIDFSKISTKPLLEKRLAQCLNPDVPNGVHEVIIDIYSCLLSNISSQQDSSLQDNLGLYLSGLFPFFSHASLQNKKKFLEEIINKVLLTIRMDEMILCFPGILASLIPGFDDNDEKIKKLIFQSFDAFIDKFKEQNQQQIFFGAFWTLLLRNQHLRNGGMKYLMEKVILYDDLIEKTKEEQQSLIEFYYPNINNTVINAIGEIILDKEISVVRNGMDFVITRFPLIKGNIFITDEAKINLIIKVLRLYKINDLSVSKRIDKWISGFTNFQEDEADFQSDNMKYIMNLVKEAFLRIFNPDIIYPSEELLNNLIFLKEFFINNPNFGDFVLSKISFPILQCVVNYWLIELNGSENVNENEIINKSKEFFLQNNYNELLWISLAEKLKIITELKIGEDDDNKNEIINIKNIEINTEDYLLEKINEIIYQLKFCLIFNDIKKYSERIIHYFSNYYAFIKYL